MNEITRRRFLQFIGSGAGAVAFSSLFKSGEAMFVPAAKAGISEDLTPVRLPYPLPIYTEKESWLATGIGGIGMLKNPNDPVNPDSTGLCWCSSAAFATGRPHIC
jgi:hypothetical protein